MLISLEPDIFQTLDCAKNQTPSCFKDIGVVKLEFKSIASSFDHFRTLAAYILELF